MTSPTPGEAAQAMRPCPWCGPFARVAPLVQFFDGRYSVSCVEPCEAFGPSRSTREEAVAAWNQRSGEDIDAREAMQGALAALQCGEPSPAAAILRGALAHAPAASQHAEVGALAEEMRQHVITNRSAGPEVLAGWAAKLRAHPRAAEAARQEGVAVGAEIADEIERLWNDGTGEPPFEWAAIHRSNLERLAAKLRAIPAAQDHLANHEAPTVEETAQDAHGTNLPDQRGATPREAATPYHGNCGGAAECGVCAQTDAMEESVRDHVDDIVTLFSEEFSEYADQAMWEAAKRQVRSLVVEFSAASLRALPAAPASAGCAACAALERIAGVPSVFRVAIYTPSGRSSGYAVRGESEFGEVDPIGKGTEGPTLSAALLAASGGGGGA